MYITVPGNQLKHLRLKRTSFPLPELRIFEKPNFEIIQRTNKTMEMRTGI